MMKENKVAYLLQSFPVLSETFIVGEIRALLESEIEILVFSFQEAKTGLQSKETDKLFPDAVFALNPKSSFQAFVSVASVNLFFFLSSPLLYLTYFSKYFLKLGKKEFLQVFYLGYLIKKEKVTHLHAHFAYLSATAAMIISAFLKIPFSFTVHARDIFVPDEFLKEKVQKAKFIIAISKYNKEYLLKNYPGIFAGKVKVIHCGIDIEGFAPCPRRAADEIHILSGGRLVEKKGFIYLIKALKILLEKGFSFKCTIFGEGPLKEELSMQTKELGLQDLVAFKGAVSHKEVLSLLAENDIFVLPSIVASDADRDGIPVVLMEAMASGLATVSTDISGIPELITSGKDGILVKEKDEFALAEAIQVLMENTGLRRDLAANARAKIENLFNINKNAKLRAELFSVKTENPTVFSWSGKREHLPCNLCGKDATELLFFGISFDGFEYKHLRCSNCGLIYADPMPLVNSRELSNMAMQLWYKNFLDASDGFDWSHFNRYQVHNRLRIKALEHYRKGGSLLEVGCGNGYFLKAAKDMGWQVYGIEVCNELAAHISKHLQMNIFAGALEEAGFGEDFFDAIYLNHILEHLTDPSGFLAKVKRLLKKDGVLFISLPNAQDIIGILRRVSTQLRFSRGWAGYLNPPMHLHAFKPGSLNKLLERTGLRVLKMFTVAEGNRLYYPDYSGFTFKKMCKRLIAFPMQFLGMGAHVIAYAKKQ
jgi:glycosyltransferase involved in cell wall biosynthesis/2-polyprenyl-3-methyl-5-hydroxy-6-metoxy-1,4-benzoquinol methylase